MVKHMIIWKLKDDISDKGAVKQEIKRELEALVGKIDGLLEMRILTDALPVCTGDVMMDSTFESATALASYQANPLHQAVANGVVRPNVEQRLSFDFEV